MTIKTRRVGPCLDVQVELMGQVVDLGLYDKAEVETLSMQLKDAHDQLEDRIVNWR